MGYPKTLHRDVNSLDEEKEAREQGCYFPGENCQEYPKMLYKHPVDKTKEHTFITVNNEDEANEAFDKGYQVPMRRGPVYEEDGEIDEQPTENPFAIPEWQDSPRDARAVLEDEHINDKPVGEKVEE